MSESTSAAEGAAAVAPAAAAPAANTAAQQALDSINDFNTMQAQAVARQKSLQTAVAAPILRLDDLCVQVIADNYQDYPVLDKMLPQYLDSVINIIDPHRIALEVAAKYIETEKFWKRLCERWKNCQPEHHGSSWKRLYLERNLEEALENYVPPVLEDEVPEPAIGGGGGGGGGGDDEAGGDGNGGDGDDGDGDDDDDDDDDEDGDDDDEAGGESGGGAAKAATPAVSAAAIAKALAAAEKIRAQNRARREARRRAQIEFERFSRETSASRAIVHTLRLRQLPSHLNLYELLKDFPNLSTLELTYGARNVGMDYAKSTFGMKLSDVATLSQLLLVTKTLNRVVLRQNLLTDDSMQVLMGGLSKNETLTSLDLSHNKIGSLGARRLAKLLEQQGVLTSLSLADNGITADGARFLGQALATNTTLTSLDLRLNQLGDEGGIAVFGGLHHNSALEVLNVSGTRLGLDAGRALVAMLPFNSTLRELDLSANDAAEEGGKFLRAALVAHPTLTACDLRRNTIEPEHLADIKKAMLQREIEVKRQRRKRFQTIGGGGDSAAF